MSKNARVSKTKLMDQTKIALKLGRFWEVDLLRGVAIILMIVYHWVFIVWFLNIQETQPYAWQWLVVARTASTLFLLLVGVSLAVSAQKYTLHELLVARSQRGKTLIWGAIFVTVLTWATVPELTIWFGILHCIAVAQFVSIPLSRWRGRALLAAIGAWGIGSVLSGIRVEYPWLLWLGVRPENFSTLDYWPLFPSIALVWLGICLGNLEYQNYERVFSVTRWNWIPATRVGRLLRMAGQHSLLIYVLHIPFLLGLALFFHYLQ